MSCDAVISAGAMVRYVERQDSAAVQESSADAGNAAGVEHAAKEEKRRGRRECRRHGKHHRNCAGGKEERDRHIL